MRNIKLAARDLTNEFWALYLLGWLVFSTAYASVHVLGDARSIQSGVIATITVVAPAAVIGTVVFAYAGALGKLSSNWWVKWLVHFLSAFLYAGIWIFSVWCIRIVTTALSVGEFRVFSPPEHVIHWHVLSGSTVYVMLVAIHYARNHAHEKWRAEKDAEVQAALAKFDPHFLFNTLNVIRQLLRKNPRLADEAHSQLATLLRESLKADMYRTHTIGRELEFCRSYLNLQRLRFGERLKVRQQVDVKLLNYEIPSLILQPLVENAIRHGIEQLENGGSIRISARRIASVIEFVVSNDAPQTAMNGPAKTSGHGLDIVNARLRQFDAGATCSTSWRDGRFNVRFAFPIQNFCGECASEVPDC